MTSKKIDWRIVVAGLFYITALEAYALSLGFNGLLLTTVIALIAGAIGVTIPMPTISVKKSVKGGK